MRGMRGERGMYLLADLVNCNDFSLEELHACLLALKLSLHSFSVRQLKPK